MRMAWAWNVVQGLGFSAQQDPEISHWDYELNKVYREIKKKGEKKNENGSEEWTIEFSEKEMGFIYRDQSYLVQDNVGQHTTQFLICHYLMVLLIGPRQCYCSQEMSSMQVKLLIKNESMINSLASC